MRSDGQISTGKFVFALRARFDALQTVCNREVDGLIITKLEMQAGVVLQRAPIASEQSLAPDDI